MELETYFSAAVLLLLIIVVPVLVWKLNQIHKLVNSRLSEALQTIEDLKGLLLEPMAPQDPRIKQAITKNS
jgi:predicted PurR-regulated permease PerM